MGKKSVINRFLVTFYAITLVVLMIIGSVISAWLNFSNTNERSELIEKYVEIIEDTTLVFLNENTTLSQEELEITMKMMKISLNVDSIILDRQGYVYVVSDSKYNYVKYSKLDISNKSYENLKIGHLIKHEFENKENDKFDAYIKALFDNDGELNGYVYLIANDVSNQPIGGLYQIIWILLFIGFMLISIISFYIAKKSIKDPLKEISAAAQRLAKGEVNKRIYIDSNDEIGELANSFNLMAESIEEADNVRRDFISNVSHELRSPITSIKGFITAILEGVIPRDKENYYLKIVNEEVSRLSMLVNDLLDISSLESGKFNLNMAQLDINEIITICAIKLENKIKSKDMDVNIIFDNRHEYCIGDRERLIQVVINLLENAVKYGKENGQIEIETHARGDLVYISIFNTGELIEKENLNKIWERFFKNDKSRTNKISTGLGLPIVRLIILQHNNDIKVENVDTKEKRGVKFTFTLKREIE